LKRQIVEPLVKEIDSQEIPDEKNEKCLSEGGGDEPEEFMPPPGQMSIHMLENRAKCMYTNQDLRETVRS
jgi:hypothetical protein